VALGDHFAGKGEKYLFAVIAIDFFHCPFFDPADFIHKAYQGLSPLWIYYTHNTKPYIVCQNPKPLYSFVFIPALLKAKPINFPNDKHHIEITFNRL